MNNLKDNTQLKLIPFLTENPGKEDSYTLCIDANINDIYKAEDKEVNTSSFLLIFFLVLVFTRLFSIEFLPMNNLYTFLLMCLIFSVISMILGYNMRGKMFTNINKFNLEESEWEYYLKESKRFYPRQAIFAMLLLILTVVCFVLLYIFPSKWWFFGGIMMSILAGSQLTLLSKTRYLLYKNQLDVNLNDGGKYNENLTYR